MTLDTKAYTEEIVLPLDATDGSYVSAWTEDQPSAQLLHGAIGLSTEAGEILDQLKRIMFYKTTEDHVNLKEEIGDCMFYICLMCHALGINLEDAVEANRKKLTERYGDKFTTEAATNRDLSAERKALES